MANKYVIGTLIFASGAAAGAGITYYLVKDKAQKDADKQIEEMRQYVEKKLRPFKTAEKMNEKAKEAEEKALGNDTQADFGPDYVDYTKIAREYDTRSDEEGDEIDIYDEEEALKASEQSPKDENSGPRIITIDEFTDISPYYDKVMLRLDTNSFRLFDELTDQEENFDLLGDINVDEFVRSDEDVMYIRNDKLGVDYEVEKIEGE